jgi:DNA polymerase III epsilon subunit family exonuclease
MTALGSAAARPTRSLRQAVSGSAAARPTRSLRQTLVRWRVRTRGLPPALLAGADLVVVDIETTGWLADQARITEIGAIRASCGRAAAEFSSLVNPGTEIPAAITALTGITDTMVRSAPPIDAVLPGFLRFADGAVIAAHNAPFDIGFLAAACRSCGLEWPFRSVVDTVSLSRLVLRRREVPDHKLATLADHFAIEAPPCHRALADASATLDVLTGLLGRVPAIHVPAIAGYPPDDRPLAATMARQTGAPARTDPPRPRRRLWSRRSF